MLILGGTAEATWTALKAAAKCAGEVSRVNHPGGSAVPVVPPLRRGCGRPETGDRMD